MRKLQAQYPVFRDQRGNRKEQEMVETLFGRINIIILNNMHQSKHGEMENAI